MKVQQMSKRVSFLGEFAHIDSSVYRDFDDKLLIDIEICTFFIWQEFIIDPGCHRRWDFCAQS